MTTVIRIGDKVTWRRAPTASRSERFDEAIMSLRIRGCKVLALLDIEGKPAAVVDCGGIFGKVRIFIEDVELDKPPIEDEPSIEDEPDKTTILSGG